MILATGATWGICAVATAAVAARPFRWPEAIWAAAAAASLPPFGLMPFLTVVGEVARGMDVYLSTFGAPHDATDRTNT